MNDELNRKLLAAHDAADNLALVELYGAAGYAALDEGAETQGCFYLTHAMVFALEAGLPEAAKFHAELKSRGREA